MFKGLVEWHVCFILFCLLINMYSRGSPQFYWSIISKQLCVESVSTNTYSWVLLRSIHLWCNFPYYSPDRFCYLHRKLTRWFLERTSWSCTCLLLWSLWPILSPQWSSPGSSTMRITPQALRSGWQSLGNVSTCQSDHHLPHPEIANQLWHIFLLSQESLSVFRQLTQMHQSLHIQWNLFDLRAYSSVLYFWFMF